MPIEAATAASVATASKNARQFQDLFDYVIPFEVNIDEDSIASGASSAASFTVTGVKQGDFVLVAAEVDADDLTIVGQATGTDEVTIIITDGSAAANTTFAGNPRVRGIVLGTNSAIWDNVANY